MRRIIYLREVKPNHFAIFNEKNDMLSPVWHGLSYARRSARAWASSWGDVEIVDKTR